VKLGGREPKGGGDDDSDVDRVGSRSNGTCEPGDSSVSVVSPDGGNGGGRSNGRRIKLASSGGSGSEIATAKGGGTSTESSVVIGSGGE
jgi:hypothetical protein